MLLFSVLYYVVICDWSKSL